MVLRAVRAALAATVTTALLTAAPAADAATPDPSPRWLSGAATENASAFGAMRHDAVEIGQTWVSGPDLWSLAPGGQWSTFKGPMSVSMSQPKFTTWADLAAGKYDANWRATGKQLARYRKGRGTTFVSPFWEFNGSWYDWSVVRTPAGMRDFRNGFARVSKLLRAEFPGVKIVLPAICNRSLPKAMLPKASSYDVEGCTNYNAWPWSAKGTVAMQQLDVLRKRALATRKPMALTEWANSSDPTEEMGGGEAPAFMAAMHAWCKKYAGTGSGQLVFEAYFDLRPNFRLTDDAGQINMAHASTVREYARLW